MCRIFRLIWVEFLVPWKASLVILGLLVIIIPKTAGQLQENIANLQLNKMILSVERCSEGPHQILITGAVVRCTFVPEQINTVIAGLNNQPKAWLTSYKLAIAYNILGNWDKCEGSLEDSIELAPTVSLARWTLANLKFGFGQASDAIKDWELINAWDTLNSFARYYLKFPELKQRGLDYLHLVSQNGDTRAAGHAFYLLAIYEHDQGNIASAVTYFEKAIQRRPLETEYYFSLASTLQELGRFYESITTLKLAIEIDDPVWMGELYAKVGDENIYLGHFQEAAQAYEQAVLFSPNRAFFHIRLGSLFRRIGDLKGSLRQLIIANKLATGDELTSAIYELAQTYCRLQQYELAVTSFESAIQMNPNRSEYFAELARCYVYLSRPNEALLAYRHAVGLSPTNLDYLLEMKSVLRKKNGRR